MGVLGFGMATILVASPLLNSARAQESLAGVGAASAIGATLGATAAGTAVNTQNVRRPGNPAQEELINEASNAGATTQTTTILNQRTIATPPISAAALPIPQSFGLNPRREVARLRSAPTVAAPRGGLRQRETKLQRQRRLARLNAQARKRAIARKYKVPPSGWLAKYLPQDRFKFGKVWNYVSTEDARYYWKPSAMAQRSFNPNRVIGFRTWQDAMAAGYKPDPLSKPEPAAQIARLATQTRGENFYRYVEYVYSGQVNPASFAQTYDYSQRVVASLTRSANARRYVAPTLDRVFAATITGDRTLIPQYIGEQPRVVVAANAGENPTLPAPIAPGAVGTPNAGAANIGANAVDRREEDFNRFRNNAGNLANVPANR